MKKLKMMAPLQGFWGLRRAAPLALGMAAALLASSAQGQAWSFRDPGLWSSGVSVPPAILPPMANLTWWMSADYGAKNASGVACAEGDGVATWVNAGTTHDVASALGLSNPFGTPGMVWNGTAGPGGKPTLTGVTAGQNNWLFATGGSDGPGFPLTCFVLLKVDTASGSPVLWCGLSAANTFQFDYAGADGGGANQLVVYEPNNTSPMYRGALPDLSGWTVLTLCYNGASSFVRVNGVQTLAFDIGGSARSFGEIAVGNTWGGGPYEFLGKIPEMLIYRGRTFTSDDLGAVEAYLRTKYGL